MSVRDEYDKAWRDYTSRGPVNWRGPHHGQPDPAFAALGAEADRRNLILTLSAQSGKPLGPEGREYRELRQLAANDRHGRAKAAVDVKDAGGITNAATRLVSTLGASQ